MFTRKGDIVTAIAVLVLVIGTATGNAYVMLGLSAAGLVVSAALYRGYSKPLASLVVLAVAGAAFAAGFVMSVR
jgi:hypothetical protein